MIVTRGHASLPGGVGTRWCRGWVAAVWSSQRAEIATLACVFLSRCEQSPDFFVVTTMPKPLYEHREATAPTVNGVRSSLVKRLHTPHDDQLPARSASSLEFVDLLRRRQAAQRTLRGTTAARLRELNHDHQLLQSAVAHRPETPSRCRRPQLDDVRIPHSRFLGPANASARIE